MPTKKSISYTVLGLAQSMYERRGDEDIDEWILRLLWIIDDLNPSLRTHPWYGKLLFSEGSSKQTKLRALIDHPATGEHEREVARTMLARIENADALG